MRHYKGLTQEYLKKWRKKNAAKIKAGRKKEYENLKKRGYAGRKEWRTALKKETFVAYGGACLGCGEKELCCLSIDHIFDDGAKERGKKGYRFGGSPFYLQLRQKGFPKDRYQLLCHNCQFRKRTYGPLNSWPSTSDRETTDAR
jgi:hypothetical protein